MIDSTVNEVVQHLEFIGQDQALLSQFLRANPDFVRWCEIIADRQHEASKAKITPLPAFDRLLALESTVFDNGEDKKFRYRLALKAFTGSKVKSWTKPDWTATATLWPHDVALRQATKGSKAAFSDATLAVIEELAAGGLGYVGVFMHSGAGMGSGYNDLHVVRVDIEEGRALIYTPDCQCWLAPFETTDAKGKPLKGNALLQSRSSSALTLDHWATGEPMPL